MDAENRILDSIQLVTNINFFGHNSRSNKGKNRLTFFYGSDEMDIEKTE